MRFNGRSVVITGAAGGIGSALTRRFLSEGAVVVATDRDEVSLEILQSNLANDAGLTTNAFDVSEETACNAFADFINSRVGAIDVLVNNAGYYPTRTFDELTYAEWKTVCEINLDGVFLMSKAMLPLLKKSRAGRIVNIGSGSVFKGNAMQAHYVSAKAGVIGFTRSLAQALGGNGITVNLVAPGLTATPTTDSIFGAERLKERAMTRPINRVQRPDDVVGAVLFLASDDASFITGQVINVDGGAVMY